MRSNERDQAAPTSSSDDQQVSVEDKTAGLPDDLVDLNIVVVRDPIFSGGGGIEVVADVARYLEAPIYTLRQTEDVAAYRELEVHEFKQSEPITGRILRQVGLRRLVTLFEMHEYENWSPPREADVVVTIGSRSQHVIHHPHQKRLHFFFTPPRWLWDLFHGQWDHLPKPVRLAMLAYSGHVRTLDVTSTQRFDGILAGSELVKQRIESYYNLETDVAYCAVDTFNFENKPSEGYFLMLTRIVPEKRVKLVIEAFNELELPLKIAGTATGTSKEYARECRKAAKENIEFVGWVEGEEKDYLLSHCEALIFAAQREDFGMPPVEAMAAGKPVVGVAEGYTQHQIVENTNGLLFEPTVESLKEAMRNYSDINWDVEEIQSEAKKYDIRAVRRSWIEKLREITE